jgi:alpha-galactosidase
MSTTKIVLVGAGSMSFGLSMFRDIFSCGKLSGSSITLVGREAARLSRMAELAQMLNEKTNSGLRIEYTTDRRAALDGAEFVINSAAIDRNRLWKLDYEVPKKYGVRHTLGENGGPGALFFTLRTIPMVLDFVRDMEELCPKALFINFSNPESRIMLALARYSQIRAVGLCHGIFGSRDHVARILGIEAEYVDVWGAGLNHFQCLLHIRNRDTGEDLYPLLREKEAYFDPSFAPFTRQLFKAFGYWLGCGDGHLGEFFAYGWEAGEGGYNFAWDEKERLRFAKTLDDVLSGIAPMPDYWLMPSGERALALILAALENRKQFVESAILLNRGVIPNLPAEAAVEVPVVADAAGVHPISLGPLPDAVAKLLLPQVNVQQLAVDAAVYGSKGLALEALLVDPVVNSSTAALELLNELWEINRPYIRKCV